MAVHGSGKYDSRHTGDGLRLSWAARATVAAAGWWREPEAFTVVRAKGEDAPAPIRVEPRDVAVGVGLPGARESNVGKRDVHPGAVRCSSPTENLISLV
jgi:hypothetical protein